MRSQAAGEQSFITRAWRAHGIAGLQALVDSERLAPEHTCEALQRLARWSGSPPRYEVDLPAYPWLNILRNLISRFQNT